MRKHKKKQDDNHVDESWLLPYSDLLTLLVALFIVLFAMSEIDTQKFKEMASVFRTEFSSGSPGIMDQPVPVEDDKQDQKQDEEDEKPDEGTTELLNLQELQEKINNYIRENNLTESLATQLSEEGLMISIMNDVTFDPGSADVNKEGKVIAKEISQLLITDPPHQVVISGHTDDVPMNNAKFGSNWELSVMRAVNFMTLVLDNEGLDPDKFSAKGYGEYKPIVPNDSAKSRAQNRRVEVLILPNYEIAGQLNK
jgi:chemotaxis protein MotB